MSGRIFNRWWLSTVVGLCLLQLLVAVIADPYCVYGIIRYPKRNFEPNTRFLKVEYLLRHPEYDAFILGSSRAGYYDAADAERACGQQRRYYNLSASLENGSGIRRKLQWLVATRPVHRIILNLDFDLQSVGSDPFDLLRQDHPLVSGSRYTSFYAKYLLFQPHILDLYLRANLREPKGEPWNEGNTAGIGALYSTSPLFDSSRLYAVTWGAAAYDVQHRGVRQNEGSSNGADEFRLAIAILHRAAVDRLVIVPPYRLDQFASFHVDAFTEWMRKMVRAGETLWDFAGYNSVTTDPGRYVDPIHFDRRTGQRILQRVCGQEGDGASPDFGVRVTAANLEEHLGSLRKQHALAKSEAPKVTWDGS